MSYRKEIDLLGELNIGTDSCYGIHTERVIQNFKISNSKIGDFPIFIKGLIITKRACATANKEIGYLAEDKSKHDYSDYRNMTSSYI